MVVDAGLASTTGVDLGERVVAPFLRRRGYRRIDLIVASHPHPDHTGGLSALLRSFPVGELWAAPAATAEPAPSASPSVAAPADPQGATEQSPRAVREVTDCSWPRLLQLAAQHRVALTPPRSQQRQGVQIEVLGPCRARADKQCIVESHADWRPNDNSLVLRLSYAGRTILLPGDIELAAELALLDRLDDRLDDRLGDRLDDRQGSPAQPAGLLQADVLKAPHHCSRTSSSESLVAAVRPQWVICSLGAYNRYRFPHAEVLRRYLDAGSHVLRTDADGAVEFRIDAAGNLRRQTFARPQ
jgi:competence protein ComEC